MISDRDATSRWSTTLSEAIPAMVWVTSGDGSRTEFANHHWFDYAGVDIRDRTTGSIFLIAHPDDHAIIRASWDAARESGTALRCEYRIRNVAGQYRWHEVRAVPVRDEGGEITAWVGTAFDVEERREAAETFRRLTETVPQLVWVSRADGTVEYWNEQFFGYLGVDQLDRNGANWAPAVHPDDVPGATAAWQAALASGEPYERELRMRRSDGVYRWFLARATPVTFERGVPVRFVGSATDIDDSKRTRLAFEFLDQVSDITSEALDTDQMLARVADLAVPEIADWCAIYRLAPGDGSAVPAAIAHVNEDLVDAAWLMVRQYPVDADDPSMTVVRTGKSILMPDIPHELIEATARDERHHAMLERFVLSSAIIVPLVGRKGNLGYLQLVNGESPRKFGESDLRLAEIIGKRVGMALENAQMYQRERKISDTFQHAALSRELPDVGGLTLNAVYMAAERDAEVGGDWYDAFELRDGRLVLSVGDIGGKGLDGAVLMASVRHGIRVLAQEGFAPDRILSAASYALAQEHPDNLATAFVGVVDPRSWSMQYAVAGHPAPALRRPDGSVTLIPVKPAPPLGVLADAPELSTLHAIPPRSLLVMYTDGLIESTHDLDAGEARLMAALASEAVLHSANPASLITDTVLFDGSQDDVAVLTVAFGRSTRWAFDARDAMAAHGARAGFMHVLRADGDPHSRFGDAELIFGELIGNVVRHAPGPIDVALEWDDAAPVLHVIDRGPGFQRDIQLPDSLSESGRGLFIIRSIATALRAERLPGRGTHMIATLPVRRRST